MAEHEPPRPHRVAKRFAVLITCDLPVEVRRGQTWRRIALSGEGKSGAVLHATRLNDGRDHDLSSDRRTVEARTGGGLPSCPGTIRHELFIALAATGRAVMKEYADADRPFQQSLGERKRRGRGNTSDRAATSPRSRKFVCSRFLAGEGSR